MKLKILTISLLLIIHCNESNNSVEIVDSNKKDKIQVPKIIPNKQESICDKLSKLKGKWDGNKYMIEFCADEDAIIKTYPKNIEEEREFYGINSFAKMSDNKYILVVAYISETNKDENFEIELLTDMEMNFTFYRSTHYLKKIHDESKPEARND